MGWPTAVPESWRDTILTGDARQFADQIPSGSVDLVFCDPVYERTEDYAWLARVSARILKPHGSLLVWTSNRGQYLVKSVIEQHVPFVLPLVYTKIAKTHNAFAYRTFLWSTPCLWFCRGRADKHDWMIDTVIDHVDGNSIVSDQPPPVNGFRWHKNPEAYRKWLLAMTNPGDIVYDPFAGTGSLEEECIRFDRRFLASEIDPERAEAARQRLARVREEESVKQQMFPVVEQTAWFDGVNVSELVHANP